MKINISDYEYPLSDEQIAKFPETPRDESKLLVYRAGEIQHSKFKNIIDFLPSQTHLVLNNTKVIPARLFFQRKTGANIEIFLLNPTLPSTVLPLVMDAKETVTWQCIVGNKRRWKQNEVLEGEFEISGQKTILKAELVDSEENLVKFSWEVDFPFSEVVIEYGNIPLPPYLNRESEDSDKENYQTIYSKNEGAVAAPTAGLHFTDEVFDALSKKGIEKSFVTLHVGAGTFMPVKAENALDHPMHSEQIIITKNLLERLLDNLEYIIPVGTTSMRTLESMYWMGVKLIEKKDNPFFVEKLLAYEEREKISLKDSFSSLLEWMLKQNENQIVGNTEIMIFPSYEFRVCKGLITNFHQPSSTLLLLVAALIGEQKWREVYANAAENNYRFLSFGDSSLLIP